MNGQKDMAGMEDSGERALGCDGTKAQRFLCLRSLLRGTSPGCFCVITLLMNCFMEQGSIKTWGQTSEETWSDCKPGVQGVKWGTCQITGATRSEGALVPEVEVPATGKVTVRDSCEWSDWEVSITQPRPFYDLLTSLQTPKQLKTSKVQTGNKYVTTATSIFV